MQNKTFPHTVGKVEHKNSQWPEERALKFPWSLDEFISKVSLKKLWAPTLRSKENSFFFFFVLYFCIPAKNPPTGHWQRRPFIGAPWPLGLSIFKQRRNTQPSGLAQAGRFYVSRAHSCKSGLLLSTPHHPCQPLPESPHSLSVVSFLGLVGITCLDGEWVWGKMLSLGLRVRATYR